jgi:hypothetical protein
MTSLEPNAWSEAYPMFALAPPASAPPMHVAPCRSSMIEQYARGIGCLATFKSSPNSTRLKRARQLNFLCGDCGIIYN